jgi:nucleolar pre-ribosomal-associated protein 1
MFFACSLPPSNFNGLAELVRFILFPVEQPSDYLLFIASAKHSYLYILLRMFCSSSAPATRAGLRSLLLHLLSSSIIFDNHSQETSLWLNCLPTTKRSSQSVTPDGIALTDEASGVVLFLEDCVQRCLKTPYRYMEELQALSPGQVEAADTECFPSALLLTVLEQFGAKLTGKLLSPSDAHSVSIYIRKLFLHLSSQISDLTVLRIIGQRIQDTVQKNAVFPESKCISAAIASELATLHFYISDAVPSTLMNTSVDANVNGFLSDVEGMPVGECFPLSISSDRIHIRLNSNGRRILHECCVRAG